MPIGRGVLAGKPRTAAGQRTCRVLIEQLTETTGTTRFPKETWSTLVDGEYMSRLDLRADERYAGAQESAFKETQWHLAYRSDMDPDLVDVPKTRRISYLGRTYNIRSASLIGNKQGVELITLSA